MRLWSRLAHPNVLPLLGFLLDGRDAIPNLISEWMDKGTMTSYMRERPLDAKEICDMVRLAKFQSFTKPPLTHRMTRPLGLHRVSSTFTTKKSSTRILKACVASN